MTAIKAQGTVLKIGDGATPTEVFTSVGQVIDIGDLTRTRSVVDQPYIDSDVIDIITGRKENFDITFTVAYDPDGTVHTQLDTDYDSAVLRNFQIVLTDTTPSTLAFSAVITSLGLAFPDGEAVKRNVSVHVKASTWAKS